MWKCQLIKLTFYDVFSVSLFKYFVGDVVAQWLVRRTRDQKVESSSPGRCTHVALLLGKHLTITVPLSTQVYKWEPANCLGTT